MGRIGVGVGGDGSGALGLLYGMYICGRKKKLQAPKLDSLFKHQSHCKAKVSMLRVDVQFVVFITFLPIDIP
jgi:hypothetical protein